MYLLKNVLDGLEGGGMVTTDDDLVVETLNEDFGLNIHHDKVLTFKEIQDILTSLQSAYYALNADNNLTDSERVQTLQFLKESISELEGE